MWTAPRIPLSNLYTQKMHEVQKHVSITDHGYLGYAVITNKKFWDGLPADIRDQLEQAMKQSTKYANDIAKEDNDKSLEEVQQVGQEPGLRADRAEKLALQEGHGAGAQEMAGRIGKENIDNVYKATNFDPNKLYDAGEASWGAAAPNRTGG